MTQSSLGILRHLIQVAMGLPAAALQAAVAAVDLLAVQETLLAEAEMEMPAVMEALVVLLPATTRPLATSVLTPRAALKARARGQCRSAVSALGRC